MLSLLFFLLTLTLALFKNNSYCFFNKLNFWKQTYEFILRCLVHDEIKRTYLLTVNVTNFFQCFTPTIATSFLELLTI